MVIVHRLLIQNTPECPMFDYIKADIKRVEGRENSEEYQNYKVGDYIAFEHGNDVVYTKITYIHKYQNIEEYVRVEMPERILPYTNSIQEVKAIYNTLCSDQECEHLRLLYGYGFLGIGIRLV